MALVLERARFTSMRVAPEFQVMRGLFDGTLAALSMSSREEFRIESRAVKARCCEGWARCFEALGVDFETL
jgi:hypothetical protein